MMVSLTIIMITLMTNIISKADFWTSQCDLCRVRMSHNRPLYTYSSMGNACIPNVARPTLGRALDGSADQRAAESNSTYCQKARIIFIILTGRCPYRPFFLRRIAIE